MKASIALLVLFLVTKQFVCENASNFTASNQTTSSTTVKPFFSKTTDVFKGISSPGKKNSSLVKEDNSTLSTSTERSSTYNTTKASTNSSKGTTETTGTTKPSVTAYNTTKGNASTANAERKKTTSTLKENTIIEFSSTSKINEGYSTGNSVTSESVLVTTTAPEEHEAGEDASNPATNDDDLTDADSTLPEEAKSAAPEHQTNDDIGPVSVDEVLIDNLTSPEEAESTSVEYQANSDTGEEVSDPQQHEELCAVYISKLVSETLTKHVDQLDPLLLRDRKMSIEVPFFHSSVEWQVGFYDGKMTGISRGRPFDECKVEMVGNQIRLLSGIYIDEALINYKGRATLMEFGPKITIDGKLSGITIDFSIVVPKDGGIGRIEAFRVRRIKRTKVDAEGLGPIEWAVGLINEETTRLFTFVFRRSIERDLRKALEDEITKISYP